LASWTARALSAPLGVPPGADLLSDRQDLFLAAGYNLALLVLWKLCYVGRSRHGDFAALDGADELGRSAFMNVARVSYAALADIEQGRRLALRRYLGKFADLTLPILQRRQLGGEHGALALIEVPAPKVGRDNIGDRILAAVRDKNRLNTGRQACPVAIAAVEDLLVIGRDRLA
jgi:hypothetical protein